MSKEKYNSKSRKTGKHEYRADDVEHIVYMNSTKPSQYVEVENPPRTDNEKLSRPQDARQLQYNRWSKWKKVYSGSYLPNDETKLLHKGWVSENDSLDKNKGRFYRRKSTNQHVRRDCNINNDPSTGKHWHWYNWFRPKFRDTERKGDRLPYVDKFGNPCESSHDPHSPHHIGNEGKTFVPVSKKANRKSKNNKSSRNNRSANSSKKAKKATKGASK